MDVVLPTITSVFEGSYDEDLEFHGSDTTFAMTWTGSDDASGIDHYDVAVGTTPGAVDIVNWTDVGLDINVTIPQLSLTEGTMYYGTVRAYDVAGNLSVPLSGDGLTIDLTPPNLGTIIDGTTEDMTFTGSPNSLTTTWNGFSDNLSGIQFYEYAIGTSVGGDNIHPWTNANLENTVTTGDLTLVDGTVYYQSVRATDVVGYVSESVTTNGIMADLTPPVIGWVIDGTDEDIDWTNSPNTLSMTWSGFSDQFSGIQYYEYAIGTTNGEADIVDWISINLDTTVTVESLNLEHNVMYFGSVRATDHVGNISAVSSSNGITVDLFEPVVEAPWEGSTTNLTFQGSSDTLAVFWHNSNEPQLHYYEYCIGTGEGDSSVVDWTNVGLDTMAVSYALSLNHAETYYVSLRAYDLSGSRSQTMTSDGITVDLSPPVLGTVVDGLTTDESYTESLTTLVASWDGFSDTTSGIQFYEYAVGTSPQTIDIKEWTNVLLNTEITDDSFLLDDEQIYYVSVRVTDAVLNQSESISTDGIIADHTGPAGSLVVDGDTTDIDRQNSTEYFSGHWTMFTDEVSGLNRHEYALYDTTIAGFTIPWTDAGIDTSLELIGLELITDHVYQLQVRGVDHVQNIGDIVKSDGVLIDRAAPATPANLVGYFSTERIYLSWDENTDEDFDHFTVYAGDVSSPTTPVLELFTNECEAFVGEFVDGNLYYLRVTATDIPGNESEYSTEVTGIPQRAQITRVNPHPDIILQPDDVNISIHFSQPLSDKGIQTISSMGYASMPFTSVYNASDTAIVISFTETLASLDTLGIVLIDIVDWSNNSTESKELQFNTYMLADYNGDFTVDVVDLSGFVSGWTSDDYSYELGPVSGVVPHLIPFPDETYDLRDIMTFTRMWNWDYQTVESDLLAKYMIGDELALVHSGNELLIPFPDESNAGQIFITYPTFTTEVDVVSKTSPETMIALVKKNEESGTLLVEVGLLNENEPAHIILNVKSLDRQDPDFDMVYTFYSKEQIIVQQGIQSVKMKAVPEKFALYHNYPNPFNPITTIEYGLPEDGSVNLQIYDILGREIKTLVNNEHHETGYYSVIWNGTDRFENAVSSGMYFVVMKSGSFRDVKKMVLLK